MYVRKISIICPRCGEFMYDYGTKEVNGKSTLTQYCRDTDLCGVMSITKMDGQEI